MTNIEKRKKDLTLVPIGGLCNRMRAITSGIILAQKINIPLQVAWIQESDLPAKFSDLFSPIESVPVQEYGQRENYFTKLQTFTLVGSRLSFFRKIRQKKYDIILESLNTDELIFRQKLEELNNKKILISSFAKFYLSSEISFEKLIPAPFLIEKINETAKSFNKSTIGVHVRRTDNQHSIQRSPTQAFFDILDQKIKADPNLNFFLATDCPTTERKFIQRFNNRVIIQRKEFGRSTISAIQCAVIDLYLLSKTNEVIGSHYSSFSHTAAELSGIRESTVFVQ